MIPRINLKNCSPRKIERLLGASGQAPYRGRQIARWLFHHGISDANDMTTLSHSLKQIITQKFLISTFPEYETRSSQDGSTKYIFHYADGHAVEGVAIPFEGKLTFCISTQVGCPCGCVFCVTGKMGWRRNLEVKELVDQFLIMRNREESENRAINVVLMGMGEPLLNYEALSTFLEIATDENGFSVSSRRLTVSTAGIVPQLRRLGREWPQIQLAVSLNASDQETRSQLMPLAQKYPFNSLLAALSEYPLANRRRITIEYVLIEGVNDSPAAARALAVSLRGIKCKVNIIPFNEARGLPFRCPSEEAIDTFCRIVRDHRLTVMVRRSRGSDVAAACGQLGIQAGERVREN